MAEDQDESGAADEGNEEDDEISITDDDDDEHAYGEGGYANAAPAPPHDEGGNKGEARRASKPQSSTRGASASASWEDI
jgi:hypothetical protein